MNTKIQLNAEYPVYDGSNRIIGRTTASTIGEIIGEGEDEFGKFYEVFLLGRPDWMRWAQVQNIYLNERDMSITTIV